jgi:hypothetical protein
MCVTGVGYISIVKYQNKYLKTTYGYFAYSNIMSEVYNYVSLHAMNIKENIFLIMARGRDHGTL